MTRALLILASLLVLAGSAAGSYLIVTQEPSPDVVAEPETTQVVQPRSQRPLSMDVDR